MTPRAEAAMPGKAAKVVITERQQEEVASVLKRASELVAS